jgi:hypothetical protein
VRRPQRQGYSDFQGGCLSAGRELLRSRHKNFRIPSDSIYPDWPHSGKAIIDILQPKCIGHTWLLLQINSARILKWLSVFSSSSLSMAMYPLHAAAASRRQAQTLHFEADRNFPALGQRARHQRYHSGELISPQY